MTEFPEHRDQLARSLDNLKQRLKKEPERPNEIPLPRVRQRPPAAAISAPKRKQDSRRILLFGGVATLLHLGLGGDGDGAHDGPLEMVAENVAKVGRRAGGREIERIPLAVPEPVQLAKAAPHSFLTDFSEREPLAKWWHLEADGLTIEPFETRMSAVPRGPSLAMPTRTMSDGQAYFLFVQQRREAGFILRGQDERDCYRVTYTPRIKDGRPEMVLSASARRRGVEREIARRVVTDLRLASMTRQHISVEMEGAQFAARLHWSEPSRIPGWPATSQEMVLATWKDATFRDGAVGVWGPQQRELRSEFRLLTVAAEV